MEYFAWIVAFTALERATLSSPPIENPSDWVADRSIDWVVDVATGLMSCAPAYVALVAEAQVDAGVRRGIPAHLGAQLVVQTLAGTAELLRERGYDTVAVRREVTSPGGLTARGVAALERAGLRSAFNDALDAVLGQGT